MSVVYPDLLILSAARDEHVRAVLRLLSPDVTPLVCNQSKLGSGFVGSAWFGTRRQSQILDVDGTAYDLSEVRVVWNRRPQKKNAAKDVDSNLYEYIQIQEDAFWSSLFAALPPECRWYNSVESCRRVEGSLWQLEVARECEFSVPDTLFTSNKDDIVEFVKLHEKCIFKEVSGSTHVLTPTRLMEDRFFELSDNMSVCPTIFQEYIQGQTEYRVIVIDEKIEAVSFDIANLPYPYDVRLNDRYAAQRVSLTQEETARLRRFMAETGLRFAAIDLRTNQKGELVFLEANPAGQFAYLDALAGTRTAEAFAQAISKHCTPRRRNARHRSQQSSQAVRPVCNASVPFPVAVAAKYPTQQQF